MKSNNERITEKFIKKILKKLSKQRVAMILQPGNVYVIEYAVEDDNENVVCALYTCHMRGWIEPINAIPKQKLTEDGKLPNHNGQYLGKTYRLTDCGWNKINNIHIFIVGTFFIAILTLLFSVFAYFIKIFGK